MVSNMDEYASAQNKAANMVGSKVLQQLSSIQSKKEDMGRILSVAFFWLLWHLCSVTMTVTSHGYWNGGIKFL